MLLVYLILIQKMLCSCCNVKLWRDRSGYILFLSRLVILFCAILVAKGECVALFSVLDLVTILFLLGRVLFHLLCALFNVHFEPL